MTILLTDSSEYYAERAVARQGFRYPTKARWERMVWSEWHVDEPPEVASRGRREIDWDEWAARAMAFLLFLSLCAAAGWMFAMGGL